MSIKLSESSTDPVLTEILAAARQSLAVGPERLAACPSAELQKALDTIQNQLSKDKLMTGPLAESLHGIQTAPRHAEQVLQALSQAERQQLLQAIEASFSAAQQPVPVQKLERLNLEQSPSAEEAFELLNLEQAAETELARPTVSALKQLLNLAAASYFVNHVN